MDPRAYLTIILVTFIISVFLFWHFYNQAKMKERLIFLEKGAKIEDLITKKKGAKFPWLKTGIIISGFGVGLGMCGIIELVGIRLAHSNPIFNFAIMAICSGLSMIIANYVGNEKSGS